jgi:hypothetical protein
MDKEVFQTILDTQCIVGCFRSVAMLQIIVNVYKLTKQSYILRSAVF